jgi:hypothetical protein
MSSASAGSILSTVLPGITRTAPLEQPDLPKPAAVTKEIEIPDWILIPLSLAMMALYIPTFPLLWIYVSGKLRQEEIRERKRKRDEIRMQP